MDETSSRIAVRARYAFNSKGFGAHQAISNLVIPGGKVLDVGCSSGYLMEYLRANLDCHCVGIELDPKAALKAEEKGFVVVHSSVEEKIDELREMGPFDQVIFGDVLEHTVSPESILQETQQLLAPSGSVVVSLPNVVSLVSRLKIFSGRWNYTDMGIMDRTHLRFFSYKTAKKLLADGGFQVDRELFAGPLTFWGGRRLEPVQHVRPNLLANQFIFRASLK